MSGRRELRRDPLTGTWVALCDEHVHRRGAGRQVPVADCPLCDDASAQVLGRRSEAWARPHRAPVLRVEAADEGHDDGAVHLRDGLGAHEVIVESTQHRPLIELPCRHAVDALALARERHVDLQHDRRLRWLGWSREVGEGLEHPHSEVVGLPVVPPEVMQRARVAVGRPGHLQGVRAAEERRGVRVVASWGGALALCAPAPMVPFEVWVLPDDPGAHWLQASEEAVASVATLTWAVERALSRALGTEHRRVDLMQGPIEGPASQEGVGGWLLRVRPVIEVRARSLGGVVAAHPAFPEDAAERLRPLCHDALQEAIASL